MLHEIDIICQRHGIKYFAEYGTMLGAIRHGGFVPWDDDLDIGMMRKDYELFRKVADAELPPNYVIHDYERKENHWTFHIKIVNNQHVNFDEAYLKSHYNFPWLASVDIFIIDNLYEDPQKEHERCDRILRLLSLADAITNNSIDVTKLDSFVTEINTRYAVSLHPSDDIYALSVGLYKIIESLMSITSESETTTVGQIFPWILKGRSSDLAFWYSDFISLPFEDTFIPVPAYYHTLLTKRYGRYQDLRKAGGAHDYPAFENQRKAFEVFSGMTLPKFSFVHNMTKRPPVLRDSSLKMTASEFLAELENEYNSVASSFSSEDIETVIQKFAQMQELSSTFGVLVESVKGEKSPYAIAIVKELEQLCEELYSCCLSLQTDKGSVNHKLSKLEITIDHLKSSIEKNILSRKEVLFLPIGPREWQTFNVLHNQLKESPDIDLVVVPLPLFTKDLFGNATMSFDEIENETYRELYPEDIELQKWETYNIELHCPETIYIQNPYDNTNIFLSVPQVYYAENLRRYTSKLIYVPIGATSEFTLNDSSDMSNLNFYVTSPGLIYADQILVQSENIKTNYLHALTQFAGDDTLEYWRKKIAVAQDVFKDDISQNKNNKQLLFVICVNDLYEHNNILSSIENRLTDLMLGSGDVSTTLAFYPDHFSCSNPESQKRLDTTRHIIEKTAIKMGINITSINSTKTFNPAEKYDAFYGSICPVLYDFIEHGKPVMWANYNI